MNNSDKDMELLAPAGSISALKYAINCGADAVYFGLGEHNARIKATDFDVNNLSQWVDYCHLFGVKAYITLNTLVKEEELPRIKELIRIIDKANADAIIVTDIATLSLARKIAPSLNIHISTQAGTHNALSAKFYKNLGVCRVVLARESLDCSINDIRKNVDIEIETFVHGAICVSMSGACLLSSVSGGNSGNRGQCTQPCRKMYAAFDNNNRFLQKGYLLSAADFADNINNQVDSLKIEGRLKRPEYVGIVTDYYKKKLKGEKADITQLKKIYNRGEFVNAYPRCSSLIYKDVPNHIGISIGEVIRVFEKGGYTFAEITSSHPLKKGDGLKILRKGKECGGALITSVQPKGTNFVIPISKGVQKGDEVRLTTDSQQLEQIKTVVKRLPVDMDFEINGIEAVLTVKYQDIFATVKTGAVEKGNLNDLQITAQLTKTKDTPFFAENIEVNSKGGYLSKSALNAMRREALSNLEANIISSYNRQVNKNKQQLSNIQHNKQYNLGYRLIEIQEIGQLKDRQDKDVIILNPTVFNVQSIKQFGHIDNCYIKMPRLNLCGEFEEVLEYAKIHNIGLLADNVYVVQYARDNNLKYIAGMGLNITNSIAFDYYSDACHILLSPEVTNTALLERGGGIFALGYLPLMTLAHCPLSVVYGADSCRHKGEVLYYKEGVHRFAIVPTVNKECQYTLYNGIVHNLLSKVQPLGYNIYINMLHFDSIEDLSQTKGTLGHYQKELK